MLSSSFFQVALLILNINPERQEADAKIITILKPFRNTETLNAEPSSTILLIFTLVESVNNIMDRVIPVTIPRFLKSALMLPAIPRRFLDTDLIILLVFGDWNRPEPTPRNIKKIAVI